MNNRRRCWLMGCLLVLLYGCAGQPLGYRDLPGLAGDPDCRALLSDMQQRFQQQGTDQGWGHPIAGYPYLRSSRLLASFRTQLDSEARRAEWWRRLRLLGDEARQRQLDRLHPPYPAKQRQTIEHCIAKLAAFDRHAAARFDEVRRLSRIRDSYHEGYRLLGLFPITRLPVLGQISREQSTWHLAFNNPQLLKGAAITYRPPSWKPLPSGQLARWLEEARAGSALGIPQLPEAQMERVLKGFAPAWRVYQAGTDDRVGRVVGDKTLGVRIDTERPVGYTYPSYTRFAGQVLLQLNYWVWFPARTPQSRFDPYSGRLDGLIWRVTLGADGRVLTYDSIHPCGCYHRLYPLTARVRLRDGVGLGSGGQEQPLIHPLAGESAPVAVTVHLQAKDHYVIGLTGDRPQASDASLELLPYQELLGESTVPGEGLFSAKGRNPQSARTERYFLWPMGVESPGAMRQWGHHAISFTDIRHFDDPFLLEQWLQPR